MPSIPKWLGDTMETMFSNLLHLVQVTNTSYLDERLKKIRFEGDLSRVSFSAGNVVQFRVADNEYRHYTPSFFDKEKGICEILFYLHGKGPGSQWANSLQIGDTTRLRGPGGSMQYKPGSKYHFFFGDETSLGLFYCLKQMIEENGQEYLCLLELDEAYTGWVSLSGVYADVVNKTPGTPALGSIQWINMFPELDQAFWQLWQHASFYLAGNAQSVQALRKALRAKGISYKQIQTLPYWAEGKRGL